MHSEIRKKDMPDAPAPSTEGLPCNYLKAILLASAECVMTANPECW
jgi:hypothetical protein